MSKTEQTQEQEQHDEMVERFEKALGILVEDLDLDISVPGNRALRQSAAAAIISFSGVALAAGQARTKPGILAAISGRT